MIFRPHYIIKFGYLTIPMLVLFLTLCLLIMTSSGKSLLYLIGMLILLIAIITAHRIMIYRFGERVILNDSNLIMKNFITPLPIYKVFRLQDLHKIVVIKFYKPNPNPNIYTIVFNVDVNSKDNITLTKQNSFTLGSSWSDYDIMRLLRYIKVKYSHIDVNQTIVDRYLHVGSQLKRSIF